MITKRTIIDQIECTRGGVVQIRMRKEIIEEGQVLSFEYHRTALNPGVTAATQFAVVNKHLAALGYPAVGATDVDRVARIAAVHRGER